MALNLRENPAWQAAVAREREIREAAYLGLPTLIGGAVSIPPLTLRQQIVLFAIGNPIARGGEADVNDAALFLWVLQPEYAPERIEQRNAFLDSLFVSELDWQKIIAELRDYYAEQTLDSLRSKKKNSADPQAPPVCGAASYVGYFAKAFGWTRQQVLDSPVACLDQERRWLRMGEPRHGIEGGALTSASEENLVLERRRRRAEAAKKAKTP